MLSAEIGIVVMEASVAAATAAGASAGDIAHHRGRPFDDGTEFSVACGT